MRSPRMMRVEKPSTILSARAVRLRRSSWRCRSPRSRACRRGRGPPAPAWRGRASSGWWPSPGAARTGAAAGPSLRERRAVTPRCSQYSSVSRRFSRRRNSAASWSMISADHCSKPSKPPSRSNMPAAVQPQQAAGQLAQEGAVVADHQDAAGEARQLLFQPLDGRQVEMVGRLVQQQQIRPADQGARQRRAPAFAAGQASRARGCRPASHGPAPRRRDSGRRPCRARRRRHSRRPIRRRSNPHSAVDSRP